jgi:signal peptidase I
MKKGEFGGVKPHDWHTFIKVINNFSIHIYILFVYIFLYFYIFYLVLKQVTIFFIVTICSTSMSPK